MNKETLTQIINTLASVKVEVSEAPKILGCIQLLQQSLEGGETDGSV
jgi:hypothetical protein